MSTAFPDLESFRSWARKQFSKYRGSVGFVESKDKDGCSGIGTCFHVGEGVFVTARHVIESRTELKLGFDDNDVKQELLRKRNDKGDGNADTPIQIDLGSVCFHPDASIDVACFRAAPFPETYIPLGRHIDAFLMQYDLVLRQTLVMGYPRIPLSNRPALVASIGEVNALVRCYIGSNHPHFIVSTMARGGFSGGPVLVAYDELNESTGTAALGLVTQEFATDGEAAGLGYMGVLTVEPIHTCLYTNYMLPDCQKMARLAEGK